MRVEKTEAETPPKAERNHASWIAAYMDYVQGTEAPELFHLWTGVSTLCGALNRSVCLHIGPMRIYPSCYIVLVAPPGVATKSSTAKIGNDLLMRAGAIAQGSTTMTYQRLVEEMAEATKVVQIEEGGPQVAVSPLNIFASELGVFLKTDDDDMIDFLTQMWDGEDSYSYATKGGGKTKVPRPYLNLMAGTTGKWLSKQNKYIEGGGLFSRIIFLYAEEKARLIALPSGGRDPHMQKLLVEDLIRISKMRGNFVLEPEVESWITIWYEELWKNPPKMIAGSEFEGYRARRQTHLLKVAMVVCAARTDDMRISLSDIQTASNMLIMSEASLQEVYSLLSPNTAVAATKKVEATLRRKAKWISERVLFAELRTELSHGDFDQAMKALEFARKVQAKQSGGERLVRLKS